MGAGAQGTNTQQPKAPGLSNASFNPPGNGQPIVGGQMDTGGNAWGTQFAKPGQMNIGVQNYAQPKTPQMGGNPWDLPFMGQQQWYQNKAPAQMDQRPQPVQQPTGNWMQDAGFDQSMFDQFDMPQPETPTTGGFMPEPQPGMPVNPTPTPPTTGGGILPPVVTPPTVTPVTPSRPPVVNEGRPIDGGRPDKGINSATPQPTRPTNQRPTTPMIQPIKPGPKNNDKKNNTKPKTIKPVVNWESMGGRR